MKQKTTRKPTREQVKQAIKQLTTGEDADETCTSKEIKSRCSATDRSVRHKLRSLREYTDAVRCKVETDPQPKYHYWWEPLEQSEDAT